MNILGLNLTAFLILICLIGVGIYDLYLVYKKKPTITSKIRKNVATKWMAVGAFCIIMCLIWWLLGPNYFVTILCGGLLGHFFLWE